MSTKNFWSTGHFDGSHNCGVWQWAQGKSPGKYVYWLLQFLHKWEIMANSQNKEQKMRFLEYFRVFSAKKPLFCKKTDHHCVNNYGEVIGSSLTCRKRAMVCEFSVANPENSFMVLYCSATVLDNFCSFGQCSVATVICGINLRKSLLGN